MSRWADASVPSQGHLFTTLWNVIVSGQLLVVVRVGGMPECHFPIERRPVTSLELPLNVGRAPLSILIFVTVEGPVGDSVHSGSREMVLKE